ncbi:dicarboxylate/amino acid:cation symporter [Chlorobium sp. N1]|uniref:dicarboxylate/amino acid:cation symporter n=1 Tax=Chlorobium sp. N1 TaxID=2491138 RepID=UPI001039BA61|nr:dicarboxylate/amino acid:cation symporter [Chlorobium sp. N1]TCD48393.1 dicarboxylate/amino acid:cation symporter [Chlorobium sp. N1]
MPEQPAPKGNGKLLIGIIAGIATGSLLGGLWPETGASLHFLGSLFVRFLMMLVMPLIVAAMVVGISRLGDIRRLGSLGGRTVGYYLGTTAISVLTGIALVLWIQPGRTGMEQSQESFSRPDAPYRIESGMVLLEGTRLPDLDPSAYSLRLNDRNISASVTKAERSAEGTILTVESWNRRDETVAAPRGNGLGISLLRRAEERFMQEERGAQDILREVVDGLVPSNIFRAMADNEILPVILFSLLLGAALSMSGEAGRAGIDFFISLNEAMMKIIHLAMYLAPVGIGALIAGRLGEAGGFAGFWPELRQLSSYAFTVILGLAVHSLLWLPLLLRIFGRTSPATFARNTLPALLTAFSTASSSATLPLTLECAEEKNGVSPKTAGFVLPLGATVNMDGTALYEAVAVIFIAQMNGIALGPAELGVIFLTATLAAIGAAGIPEAGLVTMVIVLKAVDLPVEGIALILSIDWFLDRCRTAVNVWGDSVGAKVVDAGTRG